MPRPRTATDTPTRTAGNLNVDAKLLHEAKDLEINLSATLERALAEELCRSRRERWLADNRKGIEAYNELVDRYGAFADTLRRS